jgi:hypothetical protein
MLAIPIAGRAWVEAFHGCKTSVGINPPECDAHSLSSVRILAYMEKRHREVAQFAMVVVK